MAAKRSWSDLSPTQRKVVMATAAGEVVLTGWAVRDLKRRSAADVRGRKAVWGVSFVVQPFGPLAYWAFGRR